MVRFGDGRVSNFAHTNRVKCVVLIQNKAAYTAYKDEFYDRTNLVIMQNRPYKIDGAQLISSI